MERIDRIGLGSVIGVILFIPPTIPIALSLLIGVDANNIHKYDTTIDLLKCLLPLVGLIIGGAIGGYVRNKKRLLSPFKSRSWSISFWCSIIFTVLGLEIGFLLSPVTLIGVGNTTTGKDVWIFSFMFGIAGAVLGVIASMILFIIFSSQSKT